MVDNLESRLIEKSRRGDPAAFGELVKLYRRQLYSYLLKMSGSRMAAEDILQDTLIKVWNGMKNYDERQKFSSWLFSIAHNCSIDYLRKRKLAEETFIELDEDTAEGKDIQDLFAAKEFKEKLDAELNQLPFKQKQVFFLRQFGEFSFKEISEITKEPLNESVRRKEMEEYDKKKKEREALKLKVKGEVNLPDKESKDFELMEGANILADLIQLRKG